MNIWKNMIDKKLSVNLIALFQTGLRSPILFPSEKNGTFQFCISYQKLNAISVRDLYTLSSTGECTKFVGDARALTALNASHTYRQEPITI